jgi:cobalt/nickel transport system permease protein
MVDPLSGGHAHGLYVHGRSTLHRMRPQCKVAAGFLFVCAVVATPRETVWVYAAYALMLLVVARIAHVSPSFVARRLVIEVPFLLFAVFLPLLAGGPRLHVLGIALSEPGLWAAWNIAAKATLGLSTTILLGATTTVAEVLHGLESLRMPRVIVGIAHFMVRYADLIMGEMKRMKIARESRGYSARWIWRARAVASSIGALFVRSYERGERVYLAMVSRGYNGAVPLIDRRAPTALEWTAALAFPASAAALASIAWLVAT